MKVNWKKIASIGLSIGSQFFPILGLVEEIAFLKGMSSKDKQNTAVNMLRSQVVANLLPDEIDKVLNDPRFDVMLRNMIDGGVMLNNLVAEIVERKS